MSVEEDVAFTTVQTLLRIMADKKFVAQRNQNRTLFYKARYSPQRVTSRFLHKVFDGSVDRLVMSMLEAEAMSAAELRQLEDASARRAKNAAARRDLKMPAMNAVFFAMLQWCGIGFVLLAVGSLLCWRCRRWIERLRCIQMTFVALAVACLLQVLPVLPRWNLGWLATDPGAADQWHRHQRRIRSIAQPRFAAG